MLTRSASRGTPAAPVLLLLEVMLITAVCCTGQSTVPLEPDERYTAELPFAFSSYFSIPIPADSHDGLVVDVAFPRGGLVHVYVRCAERPTLKEFDQASRPSSTSDNSSSLYMPITKHCWGKLMHIMLYGYKYTPVYTLVAHFGGTLPILPRDPLAGSVAGQGSWQYYKLDVRNYARLRIVVQLTGQRIGWNGIYMLYKSGSLPNTAEYEARVRVYKSPTVTCIDRVLPTQGRAYIGILGDVGETITYKVAFVPNPASSRCMFESSLRAVNGSGTISQR